jgi:hypothetical protein
MPSLQEQQSSDETVGAHVSQSATQSAQLMSNLAGMLVTVTDQTTEKDCHVARAHHHHLLYRRRGDTISRCSPGIERRCNR